MSTLTAQPTLTLDECILSAHTHNNRVVLAESRVCQAVFDKNALRSAYYPQIYIEGTWTNNTNSLDGSLTQFQNFQTHKALGLSTQWLLWDFFSTWRKVKGGELRVEATLYEKTGILNTLEEDVRSAYIQILQQEETIQVLSQSIHVYETQLSSSNKRYEEGLVKHSDVLTIQVQLLEKEQELLKAKHALFGLHARLNQLMGSPLFQPLSLAPLEEPMNLYPFEEAYAYALSHRPELLSLRKDHEALAINLRGAFWTALPTIYAFANTNYTDSRTAVSAGLGLKMPLFEGGRNRALINKARESLCQLTTQIEELSQAIAIEVNTTCLQFEEILQSIQLGQQAVALAQEGLENAQKQYDEGLVSINDVLLAEHQLSATRLKHLSTLFRYHLTLAHLLKITGGYPSYA